VLGPGDRFTRAQIGEMPNLSFCKVHCPTNKLAIVGGYQPVDQFECSVFYNVGRELGWNLLRDENPFAKCSNL
jgi:hypothetical protein